MTYPLEERKARARVAMRRWREENRELSRQVALRWYHENKAERREKNNASRLRSYHKNKLANASTKSERGKKYRAKNLAYHSAYQARWRAANPEKSTALYAKRRARVRQAMPVWVDPMDFLPFYAAAKLTGMHVDHIIPLAGKRVSGLHVPWNLQLLTPTQNHSKNNHFNQ